MTAKKKAVKKKAAKKKATKKAPKKKATTHTPKKAAAKKPSTEVPISELTLGQLADKLITVRNKRLALNDLVKELSGDQALLEAQAIRALTEVGLQKASGSKATISRNSSDIAVVDDWNAFYKWVHKKKDYGTLQRRLSQQHLKALREDGIQPDGLRVEAFVKLSITATTTKE
ncbi:unnamed protein product [marine sediment metagenome]|uniref:Uncharacterized protein n=1 Tax=marine sediment metagenome TaxID=412755 RepID=X0TRS1_9ZZZZ